MDKYVLPDYPAVLNSISLKTVPAGEHVTINCLQRFCRWGGSFPKLYRFQIQQNYIL
jgi:hypothetical protein